MGDCFVGWTGSHPALLGCLYLCRGGHRFRTHFGHEEPPPRHSRAVSELAPLHQVGYDRRDKESQVYRGVFIIAAHRAFVSGCEGSSMAELRAS